MSTTDKRLRVVSFYQNNKPLFLAIDEKKQQQRDDGRTGTYKRGRVACMAFADRTIEGKHLYDEFFIKASANLPKKDRGII